MYFLCPQTSTSSRSLTLSKNTLPISYALIIIAHAGATLATRAPRPLNNPRVPSVRRICKRMSLVVLWSKAGLGFADVAELAGIDGDVIVLAFAAVDIACCC